LNINTHTERKTPGEEHRQTKNEGHMKMEPQTGVVQLQVKEELELREAGRGKEGFSPINYSMGLPTPSFQTRSF
jgi:hypothetical protein